MTPSRTHSKKHSTENTFYTCTEATPGFPSGASFLLNVASWPPKPKVAPDGRFSQPGACFIIIIISIITIIIILLEGRFSQPGA